MPPPDLKSLKKTKETSVPTKPAGSTTVESNGEVDSGRRGFFAKFSAVVIGGVITIFPLAAGLLMFADPLRRQGARKRSIKVTTLDAIPDDGVPRAFPVIADRQDAWTYHPKQPIGAVFLRRTKGEKTPVALQTTCPHAGCRIDFVSSDHCFKCPCHNSSFQLDGAIIQPSPSPRAMDSLACRVDERGDVWVDFEEFDTGKAAKIPKG